MARLSDMSDEYELAVSVDRDDAVFAQDECVGFVVSVTHNSEPVAEGDVGYALTQDCNRKVRSGRISLENGRAVIHAGLPEPGVICCELTYPADGDPLATATMGAAVAPLAAKPSLPPPDDFDEFWDEQLRELARVPIESTLVPVESADATLETFDVTVNCLGARNVRGYYARPTDCADEALPALLLCQGAGVFPSTTELVTKYAARGYLAMEINAHGIENGMEQSYYDDLANGELANHYTDGMANREESYLRGMHLRVRRALDTFPGGEPHAER